MKKRLLVLCLVGIASMSLASCEEKMTNDDGEALLRASLEKTTARVSDAIKQDFVGLTLSSDSTIKMDLKIDDESLNANVSNSMVAQANVNLKDIRSDNSTLADTSLYGKLTTNVDVKQTNQPDTKLSEEVLGAFQNNKYYQYHSQAANDLQPVVEKNVVVYDNDTIKEAQSEFKELLKEIEAYFSENQTPEIGDVTEPLVPFDVTALLEKTQALFDGTITSVEYLNYIDQNIYDIEDEIIPMISPVVDIMVKANPFDYFSYTKSEKGKDVTLKVSLDYDKWKEKLQTTLDEAITSNANNVILPMIKNVVTGVLPTEVNFAVAMTVTNDEYISNVSVETKVNGAVDVEALVNSLSGFLPQTMADFPPTNTDDLLGELVSVKKIEYNVEQSTSYSVNISSTAVKVNPVDENLFK